MKPDYPVRFDVVRPERFARVQLGLRLLLFILIGLLGTSLGAFFLLLYLGLPAVAAICLSTATPERFLEGQAPVIVKLLRWVIAMYAYFALLTDQFPRKAVAEDDETIRLEVQPGGRPTVGSALLRILYGLPSAIVLAVLMWFAGIAWIIAFVLVLVRERYGGFLYEFQAGIVRWMVRLLAYQASIVEPYPPFSVGPEPAPRMPPAQPHPV